MKYNGILFAILIFSVMMSYSVVFTNLEKAWAQFVATPIEGTFQSCCLEYNPSNQDMYVTTEIYDSDNSPVSVIDSATNTVIDTVEIPVGPIDLKYNPSNQDMFVTTGTFLETGGLVYVIEGEPSLTANAGHDQTVNSGDTVQLDGSASSDPSGGTLTYQWIQTSGPSVTLSDSTSANPTFTAPEVTDQTDLTFELTVTNEQGITSEPDAVVITINPITVPPPEQPRTIGDLVKGIIQNPLNVTNSIDSANEIKNILTDDNEANDQLVCHLIDSGDEYTSNIQKILNC